MPADLEHPWLGLESYQAETRAYFFGRDQEVAELHLRLRSHPLLVLYGRSGLGKTSILNAGLIPRLVAEQQVPVLHRFDYNNERLGPAEQLMLLLFRLAKMKTHGTSRMPLPGPTNGRSNCETTFRSLICPRIRRAGFGFAFTRA